MNKKIIKNEISTVDIKNLELSVFNPRFENKKHAIDDYTVSEIKKFQNNTSEKEIIIKILSKSGNLTKLKELYYSISNGFNETEKIHILNTKEDKKIVIEGNRRVLVLKSLNKVITLPAFNTITLGVSEDHNQEIIDTNNEELSSKIALKNYEEIQRIIEEYQKNKTQISVEIYNENNFENIIELDEILQRIMFSKHNTGENVGKESWSRITTLTLLLNQLKKDRENNVEISKTINKLAMITSRPIDKLKKDIKSAIWIHYLLEHSNEKVENFIKQYKISALEKQFIKTFIKTGDNDRFDKYIEYKTIDLNKYKIGDDLLILKNENQKDINSFCKFIISQLKEGFLRTRPIKDDANRKIQAIENIKQHFGELTKKKPGEKYNIRSNVMLGKINSENSEKTLVLIKELVDSSQNIYNKLKKLKQVPLFNASKYNPIKKAVQNLKNQLKFLTENTQTSQEVPINALCATSRQLIDLMAYIFYSVDIIQKIMPYKIKGKQVVSSKKSAESFENLIYNPKISYQSRISSAFLNRMESDEINKNTLCKVVEELSDKKINCDQLDKEVSKETHNILSQGLHNLQFFYLDESTTTINETLEAVIKTNNFVLLVFEFIE